MENQYPKGRYLDGPVRRRTQKTRNSSKITTPTASAVDPIHEEIDLGSVDAKAMNSVPKWESRQHPKASRWRLTRKRSLIILASLVLFVTGFIGATTIMASQRVVTKNSTGGAPVLKGEVDPTKLKGEGDGRINILLLGVGGAGHDGGTLSDTIMVASIDPVNKTVAMLSIPRDLYVKIPKYGQSKINSANSYGGPELTKEVVSGVLDLPIHYYVQADFAGFKQAVDAVGGVEINNPTRLVDPAFPCDNNRSYCPFIMPAGQQHLDGKTALKYARCRHGSCGNDFGRAQRQQDLLVALRQKALEASTLTNPIKITKLINSVGDHVRTDMQPAEVQKLSGLVKDIDISKATTKVLDSSDAGLLVDGSRSFPGAGSILIPKAGAFDYSEIQELAHSIFIDSYLKKEAAAIEVRNGTARKGIAASVSRQLKAYSYNVVSVDDALAPSPSKVSKIIYYSGAQKPYTIKYLESRFKVKAETVSRPQAISSEQTQPDIVIIVGSDYKISPR